MAITDKQMSAKAADKDRLFSETAIWGHVVWKDRTFDRGRFYTKKKATLERQQAQQANYWHDL